MLTLSKTTSPEKLFRSDCITLNCRGVQSDGNSFCGNEFLDSYNKAYREEDNILDLIYIYVYKSKYVRIFIMMILMLYKIIGKCMLTQQ